MRAGTEQDRASLKAAVRYALSRGGGAASLQHITRVRETVLRKYGSQSHPTQHAPIDVVLDLDRDAGEPIITAALAKAQGLTLMRAEEPAAGSDTDAAAAFMGSLTWLSRENADVIGAIVAAMADGKLTETELRDIERQAMELQSVVDSVLKAVAAARGQDGPA